MTDWPRRSRKKVRKRQNKKRKFNKKPKFYKERNSTFQYFGQTIDLNTVQTLLCTCPKAGFWIFQQILNKYPKIPFGGTRKICINTRYIPQVNVWKWYTIFVLTSFCPIVLHIYNIHKKATRFSLRLFSHVVALLLMFPPLWLLVVELKSRQIQSHCNCINFPPPWPGLAAI